MSKWVLRALRVFTVYVGVCVGLPRWRVAVPALYEIQGDRVSKWTLRALWVFVVYLPLCWYALSGKWEAAGWQLFSLGLLVGVWAWQRWLRPASKLDR